jgi:hypothetical protein
MKAKDAKSRRSLRVAWALLVAWNLPVPLFFGWSVTDPRARLGMFVAIPLFYYLGDRIFVRLGRRSRPPSRLDMVTGDATAAIAPIVKAIQDRFVGLVPVLILAGFPIFSIAYGAFLGGWAVRYVKEQDIATRRQLSPGFEEFTSFEKT